LRRRNATRLRRREEPLHTLAVDRSVFDEDAIRKLRKTFLAAGDVEDRLNPVIERREIGVRDRPVVAETVVIFGFEFVIAEPPGCATPHESPAADAAYTNPIVGIGRRIRIRIFLFVSPDVGVELIGLRDVRETPGLPESAIRQIADAAGDAIVLVIGRR